MSGRCSIIGKTTTLVLILLTSSFLLASSAVEGHSRGLQHAEVGDAG
jgi:hypothetical protein